MNKKLSAALAASVSAATIFLMSYAPHAKAAPEEIVVFADEFEKPGHVGYEMHFNYTPQGRKTPDYDGEQAPYRIFRFMPEVVWGLAENWNFGVHLPMSYNTVSGATSVDGFKARVQYLASREIERGSLFYGLNTELNYLTQRLSQSQYVLELRGIAGMRKGDWLFAVNPILNRPLNYVPGVDNHFNLDVFFKAAKTITHGVAVGIEHYSEFGELKRPTFGSGSGQISYAIVEFETKLGFDIQLGIGQGWTDPVDKRVFKMMVGLPF